MEKLDNRNEANPFANYPPSSDAESHPQTICFIYLLFWSSGKNPSHGQVSTNHFIIWRMSELNCVEIIGEKFKCGNSVETPLNLKLSNFTVEPYKCNQLNVSLNKPRFKLQFSFIEFVELDEFIWNLQLYIVCDCE